jgi:orotate phosphoribosyltransferase
LANGKNSNYYIDLSKIAMTGEGLMLMCRGMLELLELQKKEFTAIGGPVLGAVPIICGMSIIMTQFGLSPNRTFMVRKQAKDHGNDDIIEGQLQAGDRVIMIEDVVTSGKSVYEAIQAVEARGAVVQQIAALIDRKEGAEEFLCGKGYNLISLLSVSDILEPTDASNEHCTHLPQ